MFDAKELLRRITSQRELESDALKKANDELDLEKARRVMLYDLRNDEFNTNIGKNKYILSGIDEADQNVIDLEEEIKEIRLRISALTYQLDYMKARNV